MPRLLILADDLTGALDSSVQFTRRASSVHVLPRAGAMIQSDVLGVDLRTRDAAAEDVHPTLRAGLRLSTPASRLFLKIDSAMRGHVTEMIRALLDLGAADLAVIAPAFPARSRTTVEGKQRRPGFADRAGPVDIVKTLQAQGLVVIHIPLSQVRAGPAGLQKRLKATQARAVVVDAEQDRDLQVVAQALASATSMLPVGSAGLANAIATEWFRPPAGDRSWGPVRGPILIVTGTRHPISRTQMKHLAEIEQAAIFELTPRRPTPARSTQDAERELSVDVRQAVCTGLDIVLTPRLDEGDSADPNHDPWFAQRLTESTVALTREVDFEAIVVTGGYTAAQVCDRLDISHLEVVAELQPGIVLAQPHPAPHGIRWMVTKAGSFGNERTLEQILIALRSGNK